MRTWAVLPFVASLLLAGCKHHSSGNALPLTGSASRIAGDQAAAAHQQAGLLNLQTTEMQTDVPADVQRAIPPFKDALVQLTDDVLASQPAGASAAAVQQALKQVFPAGKAPDGADATAAAAAAAKAAGKDELETPEKGDYGGDASVTVTAARPDLLLVDAGFGIQCGEDHVLLGYSNESGRWRRVLRWQAPPYHQVSDAFGDMFTPMLLTPTRAGHPVLLVVHGTPWCTSTESAFAMDTFEVDPSGFTDKPFWHGEHGYRRADDVPPLAFSLKKTRDGFEVRASVDDRIGDGINRVGIMRYALMGNTMRRTYPIAMNSRESVSEWLSMPLEEARLFTDAQTGSTAWKMWDLFRYQGKSDKELESMPSVSYGDVRQCSDPEHFQVELNTEVFSADHKSQTPGPTYYVHLQQLSDGYALRDAMSQPDPSCTGKVIAIHSSGYSAQDYTAQ